LGEAQPACRPDEKRPQGHTMAHGELQRAANLVGLILFSVIDHVLQFWSCEMHNGIVHQF
jgi:hypothetical protein